MMINTTHGNTLGQAIGKARIDGGATPVAGREIPSNMSVRELGRRSGVSAAQISRIENGQVERPRREILLSLAEALNRSPLPLLILAGHLETDEARRELRLSFRDGAELPEIWGEWTQTGLDEVRTALDRADVTPEVLAAIAFDMFSVQETVESMWASGDEAFASAGAGAAELRELVRIARELAGSRRDELLDHARSLQRLEDLEYLHETRATTNNDS